MKSLIVIIGNPAARRLSIKKIELASIFLQKKGFNTEILLTKKRGDADLLEPTLYTCIFKGRKRSDLLRYVIGIIRGAHLKEDDILYLKSSNIEILGTAHIQVDGDYLGVTPAKLSVAKNALRLIY